MLLASALAVACEPQGSTTGDLGRVEFSYGASCLAGCGLERPLLAGSTERIDVSGPGDAADIQVRSSRPEVATFVLSRSCSCARQSGNAAEVHSVSPDAACADGWEKECQNAILVSAHAPGDTELGLIRADGQLLDQATIRVHRAESIEFSAGERVEAVVGQTESVAVVVRDADGQELLAHDGLRWTSSDPFVLAFSTLGGPASEPGHQRASVSVVGVAPGAAALSVVAGEAEASLLFNISE